jgi:hypothetical protein
MRSITRLALGALGAIAVCAAAPSGAQAQQRVRCESHGYDRSYCSVETRGGVELVRQLSSAPCRRGSTWGTARQGLWVSNGCRGDFAIGYYGGTNGRGTYDRGDHDRGSNGRGTYDDGRYGRKDDRSNRNRGRWEDRGSDSRRWAISSGEAERVCRREVQRTIRSARDGRVDTWDARWEPGYDAYAVSWRTRNGDRGTCQVRADGRRASVYRSRY